MHLPERQAGHGDPTHGGKGAVIDEQGPEFTQAAPEQAQGGCAAPRRRSNAAATTESSR